MKTLTLKNWIADNYIPVICVAIVAAVVILTVNYFLHQPVSHWHLDLGK